MERIVLTGTGALLLVSAWFVLFKRKSLQQLIESAGGWPTSPSVLDIVALVTAVGLAVFGIQRLLSGIAG